MTAIETAATDMQSIYATAVDAYLDAGWPGVLPLPASEKSPPPTGFTGDDGSDPTALHVAGWLENGYRAGRKTIPVGNIALRVPDGVAGIDVDAYKPEGDQSFRELMEKCGPLPATWMSTSRDDGVSGIRFFRVPAGTKLHGKPPGRGGIEIIQRHHRYAVVAPSMHKEGRPYRWVSPTGETVDQVPAIADLPDLPLFWVTELEVRQAPPTTPPIRVHTGEWSPSVKAAFADAAAGMVKGSRHDTACAAAAALARYEVLEHPGASEALDALGRTFATAIADRAQPAAAEREWSDLLSSARALAASTPSTRDQWHDHDTADDQAAWQAFLDNEVDAGPVTVSRAAPLGLPGQLLPDAFWTSRPIFERISAAAHNRRTSRDAVLHCVLARIAAFTPHTYDLPPLVGGPGSLNYFAAIIGRSGAGKGAASDVAGELIHRPVVGEPSKAHDGAPIGSGEGIAELYMGVDSVKNPETGKTEKIRQQARSNAYVYSDEGEALTKMMRRTGATIGTTLRSAWSGKTLGQANADGDRRRIIPQGRYRLGFVIGFQPELAGELLAEANGGTPQRFTWAHAIDPNIPDQRPDWPGPIRVPAPTEADLAAHRPSGVGLLRVQLTVDPDIADQVDRNRLHQNRGEHVPDDLDSHATYHRLKIAGLLALADGRLDIDLEDWALAGVVWDTSCNVRTGVAHTVTAAREATEAARADQHARREFVAEAARRSVPDATHRIAARIARWIHEAPERPDDGWPRRDLHHRLNSRDRHLLDAALDHAITLTWITENDGRYQPGEAKPT